MFELVIAAIVGAVAVLVLGKKVLSSEISNLANQIKAADPTISDEEAQAIAAEQIANQAINDSFNAVDNAGVNQAASDVSSAENVVSENPDDSAAQAAAAAAQKVLETSWKSALDIATSSMSTAVNAHETAYKAWQNAMAKVTSMEQANIVYNAAMQAAYDQISSRVGYSVNAWLVGQMTAVNALTADEKTKLQAAGNLNHYSQADIDAAKRAVDTCRLSAISTESNANDAIERVLTIESDIALLGILQSKIQSVNAKIDSIRAKLSSMTIS